MGAETPSPGATAAQAAFLSYASQDADPARRICDALRAEGIEVWFDQSELRGGDIWDQKIRREIRDCELFIPVISANTASRREGCFRLEWDLADQRTHMMARDRTFIVPVCLDATAEVGADVPESFHRAQWTRLPAGETSAALVERVRRLLSPDSRTTVNAATHPVAAALSDASQAQTRTRRNFWIVLGLAALAILVGGSWFALQRAGLHRHVDAGVDGRSQPVVAEKSIAVLPFVDLSEKHDQEYFTDGLSEEILNMLSRVPTLSVIGRTSSFQFKGQSSDLRVIGTKLGAAYVLEGSVRRAGDRVRVTAQLVSTRDGTHLWSNTYDRPSGDVLALQDELAAGVARAMEVAVASDTLQSRAATHNPDAYDFYLRGLHSKERYDREGFETAANYFRQALDLDPNFAAAATQLGRVLVSQADWAFVPSGPGYARARQALQTAIKMDPESGQAHAGLGWVYMAYDWDWKASEREMRDALRLAPRDPWTHVSAARLYAALGRWEEAVDLLTSALARDPLYPDAINDLSEVYARAGRIADAEVAERRVLEISPTHVSAPRNLAGILLSLGRGEEALKIITSTQPDPIDRAQALALIYHDVGRKAESDEQLAALVHQYADDDAFEIAEAYAYRGQRDEAFHWLERAKRQRDSALYLIKLSLLLNRLAPDPRFAAFLGKMNLPE
jgi:TolB-like protein/Tfp pilus assembly protein PilF